MKFGPVPIEQTEGKILAHNIAGTDGKRTFQKGKRLSSSDIAVLRKHGYHSVYIAEPDPGDVDENKAAFQLAQSALGGGLCIDGPAMGRVNLTAAVKGVFSVDPARLEQVNACEGVTFAALRAYTLVQPGRTVGTIKIIPYALPLSILAQARLVIEGVSPLVEVRELKVRQVGLLLSGSPGSRNHLADAFQAPVSQRVETYSASLHLVDFVPLAGNMDEAALSEAMTAMVKDGCEVILTASETSTMDLDDITPRAVKLAGGQVMCVGAPVDPGNLLMLAYLDEIPVLGVPGCIRSANANVVDLILPALFAGYHLTRTDINRLGYGGLL